MADDLEQDRYLKERVAELEEKIEQLRLSRRVLMNLVEKVEREKACFLTRLEKENRRLSQNNCRFARCLIRKSRQVTELESRLQHFQGGENAPSGSPTGLTHLP